MSGHNNNPNKFHPYNNPRQPPAQPRNANPGLSSPSPIMFRPPSPWAPSPPILTNARPRFDRAPSPSPLTVSNASPRPFSTPDQRGTRGPSIQAPRPRWPVQPQLQQNGLQFHPPPVQQYQPPLPPLPTVVYQSPSAVSQQQPHPHRPMTPNYDENYNMRPQPYRPPSVNSMQINSSPSAATPQTPVHEQQYMRPPSQSPLHLNYQQSSFGLPSPIPREFETYAYAEDCGPPEPPLPKSYVIYDDDEEEGPSTAEIIANQSQDYVDEKLLQYQFTIAQLQGE